MKALLAVIVSFALHAVVFLAFKAKEKLSFFAPILIEKTEWAVTKPKTRALPLAPEGISSATEAKEPGARTVRSSVEEWTRHGNAPPEYPYLAQKKGWQGKVEVRIHVVPDKPSLVSLEISSGHSILDEAALQWAKNCRVNVNHEIDYLVPIVFQLAGGD